MNTEFESAYLAARRSEGRIYDDETAVQLPRVGKRHPLYGEWKIRTSSAKQLHHYLKKQTTIKNILEVGCGNGWLTAYLAKRLPQKHFTGIDINRTELQQAQRIHKLPNASFDYCDIFEKTPDNAPFQCIILASVVQYFDVPEKLIKRLFEFGTEDLEIHIIDSPFYDVKTVETARERSKSYYKKLGVPEMREYYHHHTYRAIESFHPEISHRSFYRKFLSKFRLCHPSPFPRIIIGKP